MMDDVKWKKMHLGVIWGVVLHDPVHLGNIQPPCCHISTQENATLSLTELQESRRALLLLLPTLKWNYIISLKNGHLRNNIDD